MKKLLATLTVASLVFAGNALALGEYFPRDSYVCGEINNGAELREFIAIDQLLPLDLSQNDKEQFQRTISFMRQNLTGLVSFSGAMTAISDIDRGPQEDNFIFYARYDRPLEIDKILKPLLKDQDKDFPKKVYAGVAYLSDDELNVAVDGNHLFFALDEARIKDAIDAYKGNTAQDELLPSSPRFKAWLGESGGASVRVWADARAIVKAVDRANTPKEDGEYDEWDQRQFGDFLASKSLNWQAADYVSVTGSLVKDAKWQFRAQMLEPASYLDGVIPAKTSFSSFKYLPESTIMVGGIALPKVDRAARVTAKKLREMRARAVKAYPAAFEGRQAIFGRLQRGSGGIREFKELISVGLARIAEAASRAEGLTLPYTGSAEDLAKALKDESVLTPLCGFTITKIEGMHFFSKKGEAKGKFTIENAAGIEMVLERFQEGYLEVDRISEQEEARDVDAAQMVEMTLGVFEFAFGLSVSDTQDFFGSHAMIGLAVDRAERLYRDVVRLGNGNGVFGIVALKDAEGLEAHLAKLARLLPEDIRKNLTSADGTKLTTFHEEAGVRVVLNTYELTIAIAEDALLLGRPSVVGQMIVDRRPKRIIAKTGKSPSAVAVFAADIGGFQNNAGLGETSSARFMRRVPTKVVVFAKGNMTSSSVSLEANMPFASMAEVMRLDWKGRDYRRDIRLVPELRRYADRELLRLEADDDPDNDVLPSVAKAVFLLVADRLTDQDDDPFDMRYLSSDMFKKSVDQSWAFFESRRPCAELIGAGREIIAYSKSMLNGRVLVMTSREIYSLSPAMFERMVEVRDASLAGEEVEFEKYKSDTLDRVDAALALQAMWETRALSRLRSLYRNNMPSVGEEISIPRTCKAKIMVANEQLTQIRLEGFGHWALYDSDFGLLEASWILPDEGEEEGKEKDADNAKKEKSE